MDQRAENALALSGFILLQFTSFRPVQLGQDVGQIRDLFGAQAIEDPGPLVLSLVQKRNDNVCCQIIRAKLLLVYPIQLGQRDLVVCQSAPNRVQKRGLADPGSAFDNQHLTLALLKLFEGVGYLGKLPATADDIGMFKIVEGRFTEYILEGKVRRVGQTVTT